MPTNRPPTTPGYREKILHDYTRELSKIRNKPHRGTQHNHNGRVQIQERKKNGSYIKTRPPSGATNRTFINKSHLSMNYIDKRQRPKSVPNKGKLWRNSNLRRSGSDSNIVSLDSQIPLVLCGSSSRLSRSSSQSSLMEPNIYGCKSGHQVFGSDPNLTQVDADEYLYGEPSVHVWRENTHYNNSDHHTNPSPQYDFRRVPRCLQPILPWLTNDLPPAWTGIDPQHCLVFVPSLDQELEQLPVAPPIANVGDDLPGERIQITTPKPWAPKKYEHPSWNKKPVEEWKCKHKKSLNPTRVKIFSESGNLLHQSHAGERTADIVRKEIRELEDLMQGKGTMDGTCLVVKYQAEINQLQDMIDATRERVLQIERRDQAKLDAQQPTDIFGLRKFYRVHDEVIRQIRQQHENCVKELANLELQLEIETPRAHFRQRHKELDTHSHMMDALQTATENMTLSE